MYKNISHKMLSFHIRITPELNSQKDSSLARRYLPYKHLTYIPHPDDFDSILDPNPELNPLPPVVEFDPVPQPRLAELLP